MDNGLVWGIIGVMMVLLLLGLALCGVPICPEDRGKKEGSVANGNPTAKHPGKGKGLLINDDGFTNLDLKTLKIATRNFHNDNKIGEGGFGPVFKGTLNGKEIAVKKLNQKSSNDGQGEKEFLSEAKLVAKLQHRNLVHILGYCAEGSERLLVYEYLPNNSLDKLLFDPMLSKQLDWQMRFNIILGIARGLAYLHEYSRQRIIHADIKASNILLDQQMNPKIADFGLARLFDDDKSHVSASRLAGTIGYMAPEYFGEGKLSAKSDVYSFGVLVLEIVCGRKNNDPNLSPENKFLINLVWRSFKEGSSVAVIDTKIVASSGEEEAVRCVHVGLLCIQRDESRRPIMSEVVSMLSNPNTSNLPQPTEPPRC